MNAKELGSRQAFPVPGDEENYKTDGLTIREYAAVQIMAAMYSHPIGTGDVDEHAAIAIRSADALLTALAESTPPQSGV